MTGWVETIGSAAAICTTLCWIPQALKIIREKQTAGISLMTQSFFTLGIALWAVYGLFLHNWPIILANATTLFLSVAILVLKLRYPSSPPR
jgi:MtN3 and saliva related transmembrane protein